MRHGQRIDLASGRRRASLGVLGSAFLLLVAGSGAALVAVFSPADPAAAHDSVVALAEGASRLGAVRDLHRWAAEAAVVVVFLHLLRVFLAGGYREPRRGNWVLGVVLLGLLLAAHATGLVLPGDQAGSWAGATLGIHPEAGFTPGIVFALHCLGLPALLAGLVALHWRWARRSGGGG